MDIQNQSFLHRRVLLDNKTKKYSPKKTWDQNTFGTERNHLASHVEKVLRQNQKDSDILQKFRKEAEEYKRKKRMEKFPHLYPTQYESEKYLPIAPLINDRNQTAKTIQHEQKSNQLNLQQQYQQHSHPIYNQLADFHNKPFQLQAYLKYERTIAQKNLQLYKREQKIKKQKKQIQKLYEHIRKKQESEELEKYIRQQEEIQKINKILKGIKREIHSDKKKIDKTKNYFLFEEGSFDQSKRRNKSELVLNKDDKTLLQTPSNKFESRDKLRELEKKENYSAQATHNQQNPEIVYSPQMKKNRSTVFSHVALYSPLVKKTLVEDHIEELRNYNKRLEHFQTLNQEKLRKLKLTLQ